MNVKQKLTSHSQFSKVFKFESQVSFLTLIDLINSVFQIDSVSDNDKTMKETCNARNPTCLDHDNLCNDFSESGSYFYIANEKSDLMKLTSLSILTFMHSKTTILVVSLDTYENEEKR